MKRVYHPTLNSWQDVPAADVKKWTDAGWRTSKPSHVTEPLLGGPAPKVEKVETPKAEKA